MAELIGCCPPENTGEAKDLCRQCLEENCERLLSEVEALESEISIARSDGKIYAGASKIEALEHLLADRDTRIRELEKIVMAGGKLSKDY